MDTLYLAENPPPPPLLVGDMLVNFGDILQETSKSSSCWDMGENISLHGSVSASKQQFILALSRIFSSILWENF